MFGTTCWQTELADSKPVPCVEKHLYTKLRCVNMSLPSETPCFIGVFVARPQASQAECRGFESLCPLFRSKAQTSFALLTARWATDPLCSSATRA